MTYFWFAISIAGLSSGMAGWEIVKERRQRVSFTNHYRQARRQAHSYRGTNR